MKCIDCCYHWQERDEDYPCCHYHWDDGCAPCELEEREREYEEDYE